MRPPDAVIPPTELLFRAVKPSWCDGDRLLPIAVEVPRCSFNRSGHSVPADVCVPDRPEHNGVAEMSAGNLPAQLVGRDEPRTPHDFKLVDMPEEGNEAHCEVQLHRQGVTFNPNGKISSRIFREEAMGALARKLRVIIPPTALVASTPPAIP